jgi:hypothetical protein
LPCHPAVTPALLARYRAHDSLAGLLGVLPVGLARTLDLRSGCTGPGPASRVAACRLALIRGAHSVWRMRCKLVGLWWYSDAGSVHWGSLLSRRVAALRAHGWEREATSLSKWLLAKPERPPTRSSSRVTSPIVFLHKRSPFSAADEAQAAFEDALEADGKGNLRPPALPWW